MSYKGLGCVGYTGGPLPDGSMPKCLGCSGMGTAPGPDGGLAPAALLPPHADIANDMQLIHEEVQKTIWTATAVTVVAVLAGMYFIEEYWGRH